MSNTNPSAQAHDDDKAARNLTAAHVSRLGQTVTPVYVLRATFAVPNDSDERALAEVIGDILGDCDVLDGGVNIGHGFGQWGVEPNVTVESATPNVQGFHRAIAYVLRVYGQQCAYVTCNGRDAYEVDSRGFVTAITGTD